MKMSSMIAEVRNSDLWEMLKSKGCYPVYTPDPDLAWKYIAAPAFSCNPKP